MFMGSAYKNKGVQPLLDAVIAFLPVPSTATGSARPFGQGPGGRRQGRRR